MSDSAAPWYIDALLTVATPFIVLVAWYFLWRSEIRDRLEAAERRQRLVAAEDAQR